MKVYCQTCGSGSSYSSQKPKFCSNCGISFSGGSDSAGVTKTIDASAPINSPKDDPQWAWTAEHMDGLDYHIEPDRNQKTTIGQIVGTAEEGGPVVDRPKAYTRKRVSKKQILEDFKQEAGQSRSNSV